MARLEPCYAEHRYALLCAGWLAGAGAGLATGGHAVTHHDGRKPGLTKDTVALVAGLADLAVCGLSSAVGGVSGLLRRADLGDLLADGQEETKARGRLFLDRHAAAPSAHMEVLARALSARTQAGSGSE